MRFNVAVLVGSLRPDGYSARLARALTTLAPRDLVLRTVSISGLPLFDQTTEDQLTERRIVFRDSIRAADAVLFVTPEHNRAVPAALKNAIDTGSRPAGMNVFKRKPAAVVSQSPGALGGVSANHALRPSLMSLDMPVLPQPELYLGNAANLFDEAGDLAANAPTPLFHEFLQAFVDWIERHKEAHQ